MKSFNDAFGEKYLPQSHSVGFGTRHLANLWPKPSELGSGTRASMVTAMVPVAMSWLSEREVPLILYWAPWLYLVLQVYCTLFNYL